MTGNPPSPEPADTPGPHDGVPADDPVAAAAERLEGAALRRRALASLWTSLISSIAGPKRLATLALLTAGWCALWGSFTVANVLAGLVVGVFTITLGLGGRSRGGIRVLPLARFSLRVAVDMVTSTLSVMREVLTPTDYTEEGIIGVDLPEGAEHHLLLLVVAITVTPGTAVVAAESDGSRLYLHVLHCDRRAQTEAHVRNIARLAVDAFPGPPAERLPIEPVEVTP